MQQLPGVAATASPGLSSHDQPTQFGRPEGKQLRIGARLDEVRKKSRSILNEPALKRAGGRFHRLLKIGRKPLG